MTFGEKLKEARQKAGLSQEQLSEKLHVSRSAVAKWETGKGMPDIENLKAAAQLLNVSIDYLLDEGTSFSVQSIKERIDLNEYEKAGKCRSKQDAAVLAKFPQAVQITPLIRKKKLTGFEKLLEWTVMPSFGAFEASEQLSNKNTAFYLATTDSAQYFVSVTREFIEYSELAKKAEGKRFEIGEYVFTKAGYELK